MSNAIHNTDLVTLSPDENLLEAAKLMHQRNMGSVVITKDKEDLTPIGIVTDRDIVTKALADGKDISQLTLKDIMSHDVFTIKGNLIPEEIIAKLAEKGIMRAPVVDENDKLCGMVALGDMLLLLADKLNDLKDKVKKVLSHQV
jgi:CBS domain-containing protein